MDTFTLSILISIFVGILHFIWKQGHKNFDHFKKRGIPNLKPIFYFGTHWPLVKQSVSLGEFLQNAFDEFPDAPITGLFDRQMPIYLLRDPELIKQIAVKDFEHFIGE